jgi:protein-L-isoaspartate(D-aspartate) O-methyltransferase
VSRERSVLQLGAVRDAARSPAIVRALAAVDRDAFLPQPPPPLADTPVWISPGSTASQPSLVVKMLEQLQVHPGHRVLEVGTGSGYNAALLASLAGADGHVTTVEVDAELADRAHRLLERHAEHDVEVVVGDAATIEWPGSFDRIVVTCAMHDLPPEWMALLHPDARVVVPLVLRADIQVCAAFAVDGDCLRSLSAEPVVFLSHRDRDGHPSIPSASVVGPGASRLGLSGEVDLARRAAMVTDRLPSLVDSSDAPGSNEDPPAAPFDVVMGLAPWLASRDEAVVSLSGPQPPRLVPLPSLVPGRVRTYGVADDDDVALLAAAADLRDVAIVASSPEIADRLHQHLHEWAEAGQPTVSLAAMRYRFGAGDDEPAALDPATAVIGKAPGSLAVRWPSR